MADSEPDLDDVPNRVSVRTDPEAGYAKRYKVLQNAEETLDATSKTKAILSACRHVNADYRGKRRVLEYLSERLTPKEISKVCKLLSTSELQVGVMFDTKEGEMKIHIGNE